MRNSRITSTHINAVVMPSYMWDQKNQQMCQNLQRRADSGTVVGGQDSRRRCEGPAGTQGASDLRDKQGERRGHTRKLRGTNREAPTGARERGEGDGRGGVRGERNIGERLGPPHGLAKGRQSRAVPSCKTDGAANSGMPTVNFGGSKRTGGNERKSGWLKNRSSTYHGGLCYLSRRKTMECPQPRKKHPFRGLDRWRMARLCAGKNCL